MESKRSDVLNIQFGPYRCKMRTNTVTLVLENWEAGADEYRNSKWQRNH